MTSHIIDGILLLALVFTSLRVGAVYRELRRLRGYQRDYVQVFDQTSDAVREIERALRQLRQEGVQVLTRLEAALAQANEFTQRLQPTPRPSPTVSTEEPADDSFVYSRQIQFPAAPAGDARATRRFNHEILSFDTDSRSLANGREEGAASASQPVPFQPSRPIRLAPSVKTVRAAGGNG